MKPGDQPKPKTQHFGDEHPVANYFGGHLEGFDPYIACLNQHFHEHSCHWFKFLHGFLHLERTFFVRAFPRMSTSRGLLKMCRIPMRLSDWEWTSAETYKDTSDS